MNAHNVGDRTVGASNPFIDDRPLTQEERIAAIAILRTHRLQRGGWHGTGAHCMIGTFCVLSKSRCVSAVAKSLGFSTWQEAAEWSDKHTKRAVINRIKKGLYGANKQRAAKLIGGSK